MDEFATTPPPPTPTSARPSTPCLAADTMRRVQEQLRRGAAPTFEALLAFGVPTPARPTYPATHG